MRGAPLWMQESGRSMVNGIAFYDRSATVMQGHDSRGQNGRDDSNV